MRKPFDTIEAVDIETDQLIVSTNTGSISLDLQQVTIQLQLARFTRHFVAMPDGTSMEALSAEITEYGVNMWHLIRDRDEQDAAEAKELGLPGAMRLTSGAATKLELVFEQNLRLEGTLDSNLFETLLGQFKAPGAETGFIELSIGTFTDQGRTPRGERTLVMEELERRREAKLGRIELTTPLGRN